MQLPWRSQSLSDVFYCCSTFSFSLQFITRERSAPHTRRRKRSWLKRRTLIRHHRLASNAISRRAVESRVCRVCRAQVLASTVAMTKSFDVKRNARWLICALSSCRCRNSNILRRAEAPPAVFGDQSRRKTVITDTRWWSIIRRLRMDSRCFRRAMRHKSTDPTIWSLIARLSSRKLSYAIKRRRRTRRRRCTTQVRRSMTTIKSWVQTKSPIRRPRHDHRSSPESWGKAAAIPQRLGRPRSGFRFKKFLSNESLIKLSAVSSSCSHSLKTIRTHHWPKGGECNMLETSEHISIMLWRILKTFHWFERFQSW